MKCSVLKIPFACLLGVALIASACQPASTPTAPAPDSALLSAMTPIPTLALGPTLTQDLGVASVIQISASTNTSVPETIPTLAPTETPLPTETAMLTAEAVIVPVSATTAAQDPDPTISAPTAVATLPRVEHYLFERPFPRSDTLIDYVDRTYPYGSTQQGAREVHLGVDYANLRHTTILAVGAGTVVFAGADSDTRIGPAYDYYGNVVVIKHDAPSPEGETLYTLYGHMETITAKVGQYVTPGDPIGSVGDSGIAIGPHLHLEVRIGSDGLDYRTTRNPDLWIKPYTTYGTIAGRVTSRGGLPVYGQLVLIRSSTRTRETYTYGERVNADAVWQENFALGDLPNGSYEVIVSDNGNVRFRETVEVSGGRTTFVEIQLDR